MEWSFGTGNRLRQWVPLPTILPHYYRNIQNIDNNHNTAKYKVNLNNFRERVV